MNQRKIFRIVGSILLVVGMFAPIAEIPRIETFNYFQGGKVLSQLGSAARAVQPLGDQIGNTSPRCQIAGDLRILSDILYGVGTTWVIPGVAGALDAFYFPGFVAIVAIIEVIALFIALGSAGFLRGKEVPLVICGEGFRPWGRFLCFLEH